MSKYIYIVQRDYDEGYLSLVSLDFKTAFEHAYRLMYTFTVWVEGDDDYLIQENIYSDDLTSLIYKFQNIYKKDHESLLELALPILLSKQKEYETKQKILQEQEESKKRDKELAQLAKLKAKYENK